MKYTTILEKEEEGRYSAQCLELPGAISQGETKEAAALKNIEEAIEAVLEVLNQEVNGLGAAHRTGEWYYRAQGFVSWLIVGVSDLCMRRVSGWWWRGSKKWNRLEKPG